MSERVTRSAIAALAVLLAVLAVWVAMIPVPKEETENSADVLLPPERVRPLARSSDPGLVPPGFVTQPIPHAVGKRVGKKKTSTASALRTPPHAEAEVNETGELYPLSPASESSAADAPELFPAQRGQLSETNPAGDSQQDGTWLHDRAIGQSEADLSDPVENPPPGPADEQVWISPAAAERADEEIRRGMAMAERRAIFSARTAILGALRLIAEARDAELGGNRNSTSLAAGIRAMEEADAFVARTDAGDDRLDVMSIAAGHQTAVVRESGQEEWSPALARRAYYTFAQQKLAEAGGHEPVASMALFALGKMHLTLAQQKDTLIDSAESRALVFQQASLMVSPENYLAANELGVLLARNGRLPEARDWLVRSSQLRPQAVTWHNLSTVHQRLGENQMAQLAEREALAMNQGRPLNNDPRRPSVRWVEPKVLAQTNPDTQLGNDPPPSAQPGPAPTPAPVAGQAAPRNANNPQPAKPGFWPWSGPRK